MADRTCFLPKSLISSKENDLKSSNLNIGFIGAGKMAQAIAVGLIEGDIVYPRQIWASAPSNNNLSKFTKLNCYTSHDNRQVVQNCSVIFLCVKPHLLSSAIAKVDSFNSEKLFISVAAGVTLESLKKLVGTDARLIRCMPNTPALVQKGVCAFCRAESSTEEDSTLLKRMMSVVGTCEEVPENYLDAICGLSGSGPAYVYTVIQAMADGGVKMGLPRALALKFAAQTCLGAAEMVLKTEQNPQVLADNVSSPGGTTIHGLHALEKGNIRATLINAVEAATLRSKELSKTCM